MPRLRPAPRQGYVHALGGQRLLHLLLADRLLARMQGGFQQIFQFIAGAAGRRAFLTRKLAQSLQKIGERPIAPQIVPVPGFRRLDRLGGGQRLFRSASQLIKRLHISSHTLWYASQLRLFGYIFQRSVSTNLSARQGFVK